MDSSREEKLQEFIDRLQHHDLISNIFEAPDTYQIELFWINSPLSYQIIAITSDEGRPDGEISINGPYDAPDFMDELESVLAKPRWQQLAERDDREKLDLATGISSEISTRADLLVEYFQGIDRKLGEEVFRESGINLRSMTLVAPELNLMAFRGNVFEVEDLSSITIWEEPLNKDDKQEDDGGEDEESSDRAEEEEEKGEVPNELSDVEPNGVGTYFYQPVWIGEKPDLDFREKILPTPLFNYDTVYTTKIDKYNILFCEDGFIAIDEYEDKDEALELLNLIFGVSVLQEHPFEAAIKEDLIDVVISDEEVINRQGDPGFRRQFADPNVDMDSRSIHRRNNEIQRKQVEVEYFEELCEKAIEIYQDEETRNRINSALQAYTHHVNGEFTQSFLLAWISIEQYINDKLDKHLKNNKGVNSDRRRNLQRGGHWSASHLIELMEISDCISKPRYDQITEFRKKRNDIVHNTEKATKTQSREIVNMSYSLIEERIKTQNESEMTVVSSN